MPEDALKLSELLQYTSMVLQRQFSGFVWVQAEIASVSDRRHLYMELTELQGGEEVAKCRATLWARERQRITEKFREATGQELQAGLEVMLKTTVEFHPRFGFSLTILDIAPAYTVGQTQIKLDQIRQKLTELGVWGLQSRLAFPEVLSKVLVVTPEDAASLGDFQERVQALQDEGICEFKYLTATFQGKAAVPSMLRTLTRALHLRDEWDWQVLVVLRGGGSVTDLGWLSDETLTRAICECPLPVVTGIGHTRDQTLLDEVAALSLGTPSKVAQWVLEQALKAPLQAAEDYQRIVEAARQQLEGQAQRLERTHEQVARRSAGVLERRQHDLERLMVQVIYLHPQSTLQRGYLLAHKDGEPITTRMEALEHRTFTLRFQDGDLEVTSEL